MACGSVSARQDAGDDGTNPDGDHASALIEVSPLAYEFGPVAVNALSRSVSFTFKNTGTAPATGCSAPMKSGANPSDFSIESDECSTMDLAPNATCSVTVAAKPTAAGAKTMTLSRECAEGGTASTTADGLAANQPMFIFVTSTAFNGNLGGLAGADTLCNNAGTSGQLTAGLDKSWKALLSMTTGGTTVNVKDRFAWTGPLFNVKTEMVVQDPSSWPWVATSSTANINLNQNGGSPGGAFAWSGSSIDGTARPNLDCNGWTDESQTFNGWEGQTGSFPQNKDWFDANMSSCSPQTFSLYCVSQ
jgi:hypothetical protein